MFDYNGDGVKERTAWTDPSRPQALLALDRDGNGTIDSGAEVFGNFTPLANGERAPNGFKVLAELDAVGGSADGLINALDPVYFDLRLWSDRNQNGLSEAAELSRLDAAGITAVEVAYKEVRRQDGNGNKLSYEGQIHLDESGSQTVRKIYDVFFAARP
jgi:hypothetical protein